MVWTAASDASSIQHTDSLRLEGDGEEEGYEEGSVLDEASRALIEECELEPKAPKWKWEEIGHTHPASYRQIGVNNGSSGERPKPVPLSLQS